MNEHLAFGFLDMDMRGRVVVVIDVKPESILIPDFRHGASALAFSDVWSGIRQQHNRSASVMQEEEKVLVS